MEENVFEKCFYCIVLWMVKLGILYWDYWKLSCELKFILLEVGLLEIYL